MKTKDKVKYFLEMYPSLKDDDNRLCSNIWAEEVSGIRMNTAQEFLAFYAMQNKLNISSKHKTSKGKASGRRT